MKLRVLLALSVLVLEIGIIHPVEAGYLRSLGHRPITAELRSPRDAVCVGIGDPANRIESCSVGETGEVHFSSSRERVPTRDSKFGIDAGVEYREHRLKLLGLRIGIDAAWPYGW